MEADETHIYSQVRSWELRPVECVCGGFWKREIFVSFFFFFPPCFVFVRSSSWFRYCFDVFFMRERLFRGGFAIIVQSSLCATTPGVGEIGRVVLFVLVVEFVFPLRL